MNFQSCKKLFLDSALTSNQENLEIVNTELQRLNSDLAQRFDVVPSDTELLASRVADMSDNRYNKDAHIKYQFLTAMKTAMELGDLIQVTAKEPVDKTAIKEPVLVGDPNMSQTNVETNEIILDKMKSDKNKSKPISGIDESFHIYGLLDKSIKILKK